MSKTKIEWCDQTINPKARLKILDMPDDAKEISRQWLKEHGFKTYTGYLPQKEI